MRGKVKRVTREARRGFVLVLVLTILSAVVLIVVSLASLAHIESTASANSEAIAQARQNALYSLRLAIGQLQRYTGENEVVTASARSAYGNSVANPAWTGAWPVSGNGGPLVWLVNGNEGNPTNALPLTIVAEPTSSETSPTVWIFKRGLTPEHYVKLTKSEIRHPVIGQGSTTITGRFAYWVSDESMKVSMNVRANAALPAGISRYPSFDLGAISSAFVITDENVKAKVLVTDMLLLAGVNANTLNARWPDITASTRRLYFETGPPLLTEGPFNVNSGSVWAWRAVLGAIREELGDFTNAEFTHMVNAIAAAPRPLATLDQFKTVLYRACLELGKPAVDVESVVTALAPALCVRGDTFLIRAYGETCNALEPGNPAIASAYCEAIVQRMPHELPGGSGWRYGMRFFRWISPDDI